MVTTAELGAFLRSRRDRLTPADVGLPDTPRRRVTGLRRDEVAELAHLSTDYYVDLERGDAQPSETVLGALSTALRLTTDESAHLHALAGRVTPPARRGAGLLPAMADLLDRFGVLPAYVTTDLQIVLAQNPAATELHGPMPDSRSLTSSYVYRWFTDPTVRAQFDDDDHEAEAQALVADLRAGIARRNANDPDAATLVKTLRAASPWFSRVWDRQDVAIRRVESKRLRHPHRGATLYECYALLSEDGSQRLIWYVPAPAHA